MRDANHPEDQKSIRKSSKKDSTRESRAINEKWFKDIKAQFGELTKFYQINEETSRGAYGVVYDGYVLNPETQEPTAKRVAIKAFFLYLYPQLVLTELNFLKLTKGAPHIVQLMDFMITNQQFFIVTEFYKNQHFEKFMYFSNMTDIKYYMYSLLEGLATLHSLGIVHRDVKQGNFLYNLKKKKGLIIDFGLAEISREMKARVSKKEEEIAKREVYEELISLQSQLGENKIGTEGFMPLEQVLKKEEQSYGVDIWAAGTIFLEFLTAKHTIFKNLRLKKDKGSQEQVEYALSFVYELGCIFGSKKTKEMIKQCEFDVEFPSNIQEEQVPWKQIVKHAEYNDECEDLLDRMLRLVPEERITAREALNHPFFDEIRNNAKQV